jgi:hypothetical protein
LSNPQLSPPKQKKTEERPKRVPDLHQIQAERARRHLLPFIPLTKPDYAHVELCKDFRPNTDVPLATESGGYILAASHTISPPRTQDP